MKDYLSAIQSIDREALKAKAQVALSLAGEYAQQAKDIAGGCAQQAKSAAGGYAQEARAFAEGYAQEAKSRAGGYAQNAKAFAENAKSVAKDMARDAKEDADDLCAFSMERVKTFSIFDFAIFKFCLLSLGMWLGAWITAKCAKLSEKLRPILFAGFLAGYIYLIYRIFFADRD